MVVRERRVVDIVQADATTRARQMRAVPQGHEPAAILGYQGHVLMANRSGLVSAAVTHADGFGERTVELAMLDTSAGGRPLVASGRSTRDQARGPALQNDHDGEQHHANGSNTSNTGQRAAWGIAMNLCKSAHQGNEHAAPRSFDSSEPHPQAPRKAQVDPQVLFIRFAWRFNSAKFNSLLVS